MKNSSKSNMYTCSQEMVWDTYAAYLDGCDFPLVVVVSHSFLNEKARDALEKSSEVLGYGSGTCAFVTLKDETTAKELFSMVEGLDPLCLIITDEAAAKLCEQSYKRTIPFCKHFTLLTRPTVAFASFPEMLLDDVQKQKAWKVLKKIPKLES